MFDNGIQVRVGDLLHALNKRKYIIISLVLVGVVVGLIASGVSYLRGDISRNYVITSSIALNTRVENGNFASAGSYPTSSDYHLAEDMADAAIYILKSDRTLSAAFDGYRLNGVVTADVKSNLSMNQYEATLIIEEKLYWSDANEGVAILSAINNVGTQVLQETMGVGGINVINAPVAERLLGGNLDATFCILLGIIGFVVGVGLSILELLLRPTLLNPDDIEEFFSRDVLGVVNYDAKYAKRKGSLLKRDKGMKNMNETFSSIAHIVHNLTGLNKAHKCIYVTSSTRGEGTTVTAANLALQLSDMEKKVLLVDFNFENPKVGKLFLENIKYENSLNALYRGDINESEAITTLTGYLDILPTVYEKLSIGIDSNLVGLLKKLTARYDYVVVDTSPAGLSAGTLNLNEVVSGALLVVRYDTAPLKEIQSTITRLEKSGVRLLGCIANGIKGGQTNQSRSTGEYTQKRAAPARAARPDSIVDVLENEKRAPVNTGLSEDMAEKPGQAGPEDSYTSMLRHLYDLDQKPDALPPEVGGKK